MECRHAVDRSIMHTFKEFLGVSATLFSGELCRSGTPQLFLICPSSLQFHATVLVVASRILSMYDAIYQVCVCHVTVPHIGSILGIGSPLYRYAAFAYQCRVFTAFGLTSFLVGIVFCRMANWRSTTVDSAACIRHAIMMDLHACHNGICYMARALRNSHAATLFAFQQCTLAWQHDT